MLLPCVFPLLVKVEYGNVEQNAGEEEPDGEECECDIEYLTDDVEPEDLATLHLLCDFFEVGVETDAGEGEDEGPVLILVEYGVDLLDRAGSAQRLEYEGSDQ